MPSLFYESVKWFDSPYLNRFLQPDTIIPSPASPQSWNRYSYVENRPINFNDPTGHVVEEGCGNGGTGCNVQPFDPEDLEEYLNSNKKQDSDKDGPPLPEVINLPDQNLSLIIMPAGSKSTLQRPNWARRLSIALGITGFVFDLGELATIFDLLPGDEDGVALADVLVTYASSALGGDSYLVERPDSSLPYMVTVNQDVLVTAGDAGVAGLVKVGGAASSGPAGYLVGMGTDIVTTGTSLLYDGSRVFGDTKNYVSTGIAVTSTEQIRRGNVVIIIWPE